MESDRLLAGRYAVGRSIGAGGMGHVFAGVDTLLGRDVAIKTFAVTGAHDAVALERFRREARTAAGLQHPNIVTIYDTGVDADTAFLVMELLPGPDLATAVARRGPLPEPEAIDLAEQIASGLAAAHQAAVVHRDIKPANLVFDHAGSLRILDFGIARLENGPSDLTATQTVMGSAHYLSPEQIKGHRADARSDLYALGCVLVAMLTGAPPFEAEHPMGVAHQHLTAPPPNVLDRRPGLSPGLGALVQDLLAKSPEERPQTGAEVVQRLRALALDGPTQAMPLGAGPLDATRAMPALSVTERLPVVSMADGTRLGARADTRVGTRAGTRVERRAGEGPRPVRTPLLIGAGVVVAMAAVMAFAWGGNDDPTGSAVPPTTPAAITASTAPTTSTPPTTGATTTASPTTAETLPPLQDALSQLHAALDAVAGTGALEPRRTGELSRRIADLERRALQRRGDSVKKRLDDLRSYLDDLVDKRALTKDGEALLTSALDAVEQALED